MKKVVLLLLLCCFSCNETYEIVVLEDDYINIDYLKNIKEPERALLSWYLYAYGNECSETSEKNKCKLLAILNVKNECSSEHLNFLSQWLSKDILAVYKLKKCPNLPKASAIQNTIDKIVLTRDGDKISISYKIKGLNNSQEKSWNIERTDVFTINNRTFIKE
jgi:hypothetical protein